MKSLMIYSKYPVYFRVGIRSDYKTNNIFYIYWFKIDIEGNFDHFYENEDNIVGGKISKRL